MLSNRSTVTLAEHTACSTAAAGWGLLGHQEMRDGCFLLFVSQGVKQLAHRNVSEESVAASVRQGWAWADGMHDGTVLLQSVTKMQWLVWA